jgi:hypothetical protein
MTCRNVSAMLGISLHCRQWRSQNDDLVPLCEFRFIIIPRANGFLHYVMDSLRRYARARVQASTQKNCFLFAKMYFAVLRYIFAICSLLLAGNEPAVRGLVAVNRETKR